MLEAALHPACRQRPVAIACDTLITTWALYNAAMT